MVDSAQTALAIQLADSAEACGDSCEVLAASQPEAAATL